MRSTSPVRRALARHNGGPGLTEDELVEETGVDRATIRVTLHALVFDEKVVTCDVDVQRDRHGNVTSSRGRYHFGDPTRNVLMIGQE